MVLLKNIYWTYQNIIAPAELDTTHAKDDVEKAGVDTKGEEEEQSAPTQETATLLTGAPAELDANDAKGDVEKAGDDAKADEEAPSEETAILLKMVIV